MADQSQSAGSFVHLHCSTSGPESKADATDRQKVNHLQSTVMQTSFKYSFILLTATIALVMAGPQQGMAQRFNHGGGGGGGRPAAPAYHPAPVSRPAPTVRPPAAPARPVESRPV